ANRRFYDTIAGVYDQVDSRRKGNLPHPWVEGLVQEMIDLRTQYGGPVTAPLHLLDAGTGSGFLAYRAAALINSITLVDVSQAMLDRIDLPEAAKICSGCEQVPLEAGSVDLIGAFATLHHLYDPLTFFAEAARLLVPGGVLYTDHDIERRFVKNFHLPLKAYRKVFDHGHGYLSACPEAEERDYHLSEFHGDSGLPGPDLRAALERLGFTIIREDYHWQGMGAPETLVGKVGLKGLLSRRGFAPILRLMAVKTGEPQ
ncbi:MAG: methyltransferase domain-containing protein, partial [Rhodospirillaceae bacterium]